MSETATFSRESYRRVELVKATGRIDSSNAAEFDNVLAQCLADKRSSIVLDMSQVDYVNSAAVRAIVTTLRESKKSGGDLRLVSPSARVTEVLQLAGIATLLQVFDDATAAVGSF